jgi:hypothetical protein
MVVSETFVWLHFPKCAGTETEAALRLSPSPMTFDELDPKNIIWHQNVTARERHDPTFQVGGRHVICNFRRLATWIGSRTNFARLQRPDLEPTRSMMVQGEFYEANGSTRSADAYVQLYSPGVTRWIRTENFDSDFAHAFGDLIELPPAWAFQKRNSYQYERPSFTSDELRQLYGSNPGWAALERELYGSLPFD